MIGLWLALGQLAAADVFQFLNCEAFDDWRHFQARLRLATGAEAEALLARHWPSLDFGNFIDVLSEPRRQHGDYCVYGVVAALQVRGRELLAMGDKAGAIADWEMALQLLGKELGLDFLESTGWPRSGEILQSLAEAQGIFEWPAQPVPQRAVVGLVSWPATKVPKAKPRVVIYGYHPVLIEPVAALQAELLWFGVSPRDCAFFGVLCHQRREAKRAVRAKLRFLTYSSEADEKEVEAAYKAFWEAENLRADLVLAMELRDAYFLWKVAQVATIYYPAMIFMQDEAMDDYSADVLIRQFEEFCQQDVLSGKASAVPTAVVAQSPFLAASIEYHTRRPVPHVRPLAPYVSATYQANSSTVLVLCARTRLMMSHNCRGLFRAGARLLPRGRKLRLPPGDQDVVHGYSFQEVAQFEATVLVPWNIAVTTFHELYAMHMPMFIPDTLWLARLWPKQMTSYGRSHPNLHRQMRPNDRHPTPYPSLDFLSRDFLTMVYWAKSFSGLDLPGVQRFTSIPDLLLGLEEVDLKQISREMALETAKAREQVVPFWSSLVGVLSAPLDTSPEREGAQLSARPTDSE